MSISRLMQMGAAGQVSGEVEAQAIDFDGTNDYLSRSTDLVGNADHKTFTFSAWVYASKDTLADTDGNIYVVSNNSNFTAFNLSYINGLFQVEGWNSGGTRILFGYTATGTFQPNTWNHVLVSVDLSNAAKRSIWLNGEEQSSSWLTYSNSAITFTETHHLISSTFNSVPRGPQRLAHVFLDYTYRDLSVEANRRLFVTADLKPADGQAALNPILYLPMDDPTQPGRNDGTGGDFTLNGIVARSGRGPNQYNCAASFFDGASDYLYKHSNITAVNPSQITMSLTYMAAPDSGDRQLFIISDTDDLQSRVNVRINTLDQVSIFFQPEDRSKFITLQANVPANDFVHNHVVISVDCTDSSLKSAFFNGEDISSSIFYSATFSSIGLVQSGPRLTLGAWNRGGGQADSTFYRGDIGEFYLDTTYRDLSVDNPFWDSEINRPKPVRQVIEETGSTPLMALPMNAVNPGTNLGTGGDFTVNSGPYVGARGPSEFWASSAKFDGSTGYLNQTTLGASDSKTFSAAIAWKPSSVSTYQRLISFENQAGTSEAFTIFQHGGDGRVYCQAENSASTRIFDIKSASALSANQWYVILISSDASVNQDYMFVTNGVNNSNATTQTNDFIDFGGGNDYRIGVSRSGSNFSSGSQSLMYFTTDYIDFSQEANRLKFVDAFGYPVDIQPAIDAGDIPTPLIYMPFDDPDDLGKNLGTGGDFTVNGTVTQGGDVKG